MPLGAAWQANGSASFMTGIQVGGWDPKFVKLHKNQPGDLERFGFKVFSDLHQNRGEVRPWCSGKNPSYKNETIVSFPKERRHVPSNGLMMGKWGVMVFCYTSGTVNDRSELVVVLLDFRTSIDLPPLGQFGDLEHVCSGRKMLEYMYVSIYIKRTKKTLYLQGLTSEWPNN